MEQQKEIIKAQWPDRAPDCVMDPLSRPVCSGLVLVKKGTGRGIGTDAGIGIGIGNITRTGSNKLN